MRRAKRPYRRGDDLVTMSIVLFALGILVGAVGPILYPENRMLVPYVLGTGTASVICMIAGQIMRR